MSVRLEIYFNQMLDRLIGAVSTAYQPFPGYLKQENQGEPKMQRPYRGY